jgi:DNA-binding beta-propeller fold protein YncE
MSRSLLAFLVLTLNCAATPGLAQERWHDALVEFATLPAGVRFPEGITANPATGDVYVATFDFGPNPNKLLRYSRHGQLLGARETGTPMLGLAFGPGDSKVYLTNFNQSKIQRVAADLDGAIEDVATLPSIGAPANRIEVNPDTSSDTIQFGSGGFPAGNAMVFDRSGNLCLGFFQGAIHRIDNAQGASCRAA